MRERFMQLYRLIFESRPNESDIAAITQPFEENDDCACPCRGLRVMEMHAISSDQARCVCDSMGACKKASLASWMPPKSANLMTSCGYGVPNIVTAILLGGSRAYPLPPGSLAMGLPHLQSSQESSEGTMICR
ncbi:hypothetical protein TNCV_728471 [Trichonephila clavipes]|nr:hypothetical protein TNCV_728471 [Trichonephila clavipes]